ncbi:NUDIX domain-containing protein [Brachybacterium saurashtrense]|uniref:NUDIX domain-containing protein n=1 Tax=Brachybacterium saurashtrense TaxID=556288 RepID=A0A345YSR6_9MICO|nr:NUDIX domain-containing protein [Brachybacterium saurashtrense]AXK46968.1 NUDIX domain-containing protein [Brachybacterium saurashtrense]RRR22683.1 NUDIX domain-containing protein [Brachybacterium saurashtrense]
MSGPRVAVKALIIDRRAVLMNRYVDPSGHEMFELPGGGQEHGEDQPAALRRECREEIGAEVEVHQVACLFEFMATRSVREGTPIAPFHQVNVAYWCGLAEGELPGEGTDPDPGQQGTAWLPLGRLEEFDVQPPALARWLASDPSDRPLSLGVSRA